MTPNMYLVSSDVVDQTGRSLPASSVRVPQRAIARLAQEWKRETEESTETAQNAGRRVVWCLVVGSQRRAFEWKPPEKKMYTRVC